MRGNSRSESTFQFRLNTEFRADLAWWQTFIRAWNGVSFLPTSPLLPVQEMASNASGTWGCGAWFQEKWFQFQWDAATQELPIAVKELIPIIVAGVLWGHEWTGHRVLCHCDNQAVVACLRSRTSKHRAPSTQFGVCRGSLSLSHVPPVYQHSC